MMEESVAVVDQPPGWVDRESKEISTVARATTGSAVGLTTRFASCVYMSTETRIAEGLHKDRADTCCGAGRQIRSHSAA